MDRSNAEINEIIQQTDEFIRIYIMEQLDRLREIEAGKRNINYDEHQRDIRNRDDKYGVLRIFIKETEFYLDTGESYMPLVKIPEFISDKCSKKTTDLFRISKQIFNGIAAVDLCIDTRPIKREKYISDIEKMIEKYEAEVFRML